MGFVWYKAAYTREQQILEKGMERTTKAFFRAQGRRVVKKLRSVLANQAAMIMIQSKELDPDLLTRLVYQERAEAERMMQELNGHIGNALVEGGQRTLESVGFEPVSFSIQNPLAQRWLQDEKGTAYWLRPGAPPETTKKAIHTALAKAIEVGKTPIQMVSAVQGVFSGASKNRATLIARTEVVGAFNAGGGLVRTDLARKGIQTIKIWFSTMDDRTREQHVPMNNVEVPHDQPFVLPDGTKMEHPGDPGAPAYQICDCRCGSATRVVEEPDTGEGT